MKLGTHMPDGERRKSIDIEVCRSKVKVTFSIHMFSTLLSANGVKYQILTMCQVITKRRKAYTNNVTRNRY
jgi:hypothetical protein